MGTLGVGPQNPQLFRPLDDTQVVVVTITPTQFKAMDGTTGTSPIIVPAQGPGKAIIPVYTEINMQFPSSGGVAYATGNGSTLLGYDGGGGNITSVFNLGLTTAMIKLSASQYGSSLQGYQATTVVLATSVINKPLYFTVGLGSVKYVNGNSPFVITCRYRVITLQP